MTVAWLAICAWLAGCERASEPHADPGPPGPPGPRPSPPADIGAPEERAFARRALAALAAYDVTALADPLVVQQAFDCKVPAIRTVHDHGAPDAPGSSRRPA